MAHYLFNFSVGDQHQASLRLQAPMWGVGSEEPHRNAIAPGDLVLIYLAAPAEFVARAEVATAFHDWTAAEIEAYPGRAPSGLTLRDVEVWDSSVPMHAVVERIDPTRSNPVVQTNAAAGFRTGIVLITAAEYEAVIALSREARAT